jgi:hypothetical protein
LIPVNDSESKELRFIPIGSHLAALKWLRHFYCHEYGRTRPLSLHLMGEAGMGKSRILKHYHALHQGRLRDPAGFHPLHVILVEAPDDGDCKRLCESLIRACLPGFEPGGRYRHVEMCGEVLLRSGVRQVLIDEAGNLLHAGRVRQQQTLAVLKRLTNLGLTLCIATTENMRNVLSADEQLHSRFRPLLLPRFQESDEFRVLLAGIDAQQAGLSHLDSQRFVRWFLANGYCTTGAIEKLIHNANLRAIAQGGTALTLELLEQAMVDPLPPPLIGEAR